MSFPTPLADDLPASIREVDGSMIVGGAVDWGCDNGRRETLLSYYLVAFRSRKVFLGLKRLH